MPALGDLDTSLLSFNVESEFGSNYGSTDFNLRVLITRGEFFIGV